jgi:3-isopropylmalate/(R)-2-methylmalate dehydratase small subunit
LPTFFNNCFKNGVLPIILEGNIVNDLFEEALASPGYRLTIDLERQQVLRPDGGELPFTVDAFRKHCLLHGLDEIGLTLEHAAEISAFEQRHRQTHPWLFRSESASG